MKNTIIQEIKETRTIANAPIKDSMPHASKEVLKGRKRTAREQLEVLNKRHRDFVRNNAVFMIMCGEPAEKIAELGRSYFKCFKFDIDAFFLSLTKTIPESHYLDKGIGHGAFDFMMVQIEDLAQKAGVQSLNQIVYKTKYNQIIHSKEELAEIFKGALLEQVGGEFIAIIASDEAADLAFNREQDRVRYPILLHTEDFDLALRLKDDFLKLFGKSYVISCDRSKLIDEADAFVSRVNKKDLACTFENIKKLYI